MTQPIDQSGPGASPGSADDEVRVQRPEATIDAPVQDGAQELREEAQQERVAGVPDRADNVQAPGHTAERGEQTDVLEAAKEADPSNSDR